MGAPIGNQYYKLRSKDGKDKKYTPDELLEKCNEYFQWVLDNPLIEAQVISRPFKKKVGTSGDGNDQTETEPYTIAQLPKMRPFTLEGLYDFLDIVPNTWKNYENAKDYVHICTRVRNIIYKHKFEGAAAGFLNHNIIARDLGLREHVQNENIGERRQIKLSDGTVMDL